MLPLFLALLTFFSFKNESPNQTFSTCQLFSPLDSGLVAHYTFNKCDATDETGGGSDGVIFGNPGCRCGVEEDALWLDGVNDYLEFPGRVNKFFNTMDFTVSFYFRSVGYSVFSQSMLGKRADCDEYLQFDTQLDLNKREVNTDFFGK